MPTFSCAQNTLVHNSEFIDIGVQNIISGSSGKPPRCTSHTKFIRLEGIDILRDASIPGAAHDADTRHPSPSCFPGTREQYVEDITHWALNSSDAQSATLWWTKGPAGVGKTAVAQTCVQKLKESGHLSAAFFFSINGCDDHRRFFTTIAYQLSVELRDYCDIVNKKVYRDKTLVTKTMSSQFKSLIIEPLRKLQREGKELGRMVIFVDGLDECQSQDAQSEIIEIVAASIRDHAIPFRWAFFSRPEPHIEAAFAKSEIAPLCLATFLPVSRDVDAEIELYLRGGLEDILRRRNLSSPVSWPADKDVQSLVDASAGLFIYAAAVLRFIDHFPSPEPQEPLDMVLVSISRCNSSNTIGSQSPFAELDALYMLTLRRIPDRILPSVQLLFTSMLLGGFRSTWSAIHLSNIARLSETEFKGICNRLRGVLHFTESPPHCQDGSIDPTCSFENAEIETATRLGLYDIARKAGGLVYFYHKSFYDFLCDSTRSGAFCAGAPAFPDKLFDHFLHLHQEYARSYVICGSNLVLAPNVPNSAASLSWPYSNEFVNSYLKAQIFHQATEFLKYRLKVNPKICFQQSRGVSDLDYQKSFINANNIFSIGLLPYRLLNCSAFGMNIRGNFFGYIPSHEFQNFDTEAFSQTIGECKRLKVIRPYYPNFASRLKSLVCGKYRDQGHSGMFIRGRGDKAVYWCWKIDPESRLYREFETRNSNDAKRLYLMDKSGPRDGSIPRG